jgi:hypothetical protein
MFRVSPVGCRGIVDIDDNNVTPNRSNVSIAANIETV